MFHCQVSWYPITQVASTIPHFLPYVLKAPIPSHTTTATQSWRAIIVKGENTHGVSTTMALLLGGHIYPHRLVSHLSIAGWGEFPWPVSFKSNATCFNSYYVFLIVALFSLFNTKLFSLRRLADEAWEAHGRRLKNEGTCLEKIWLDLKVQVLRRRGKGAGGDYSLYRYELNSKWGKAWVVLFYVLVVLLFS